MRYCTVNDLQQAIPPHTLLQLSNDDPAATHYDEAVVKTAIQYAEELCDGFLPSRYVLPLSPVPVVIRDVVVYLARYWLYQRRPETPIPEPVQDGRKEAIETLKQIQQGVLSLNVKQNSNVTEIKSAAKFKVKASKLRFDADTLGKWR